MSSIVSLAPSILGLQPYSLLLAITLAQFAKHLILTKAGNCSMAGLYPILNIRC